MDVFEAHKYLDPTTFDDSSFLSFSSFADLTRSPYDDDLSFLPSSDPQSSVSKPQRSLHPLAPQVQPPYHPHLHRHQSFGIFEPIEQSSPLPRHACSTPTPPCSHSDWSAESPPPSDPFLGSGPTLYTPVTPAVHDFGISQSPSSSFPGKAGPSRLPLGPTTTPSHHVSHRSTSSSDWNSPVTPTLTNKSSIDSLASFAPAPDFFLPPPSHKEAFGWDDQSLGSSSSLAIPRSPPSPSPYRVASNPVIGPHRHPRAIKPVTSLPSLREEGNLNMDTTIGMGLTPGDSLDAFDFEQFSFLNDRSYDASCGLETAYHLDTWIQEESNPCTIADADTACPDVAGMTIGNSDPSDGSSSRTSTSHGTTILEQPGSVDSQPIDMLSFTGSSQATTPTTVVVSCSEPVMAAPSLVPNLTSSTAVSDDNVFPDLSQFPNWQDLFAQQDLTAMSSVATTYSQGNLTVPPKTDDARPLSAPEPAPTYQHPSASLAVPPYSVMARSMSSDAVHQSRPTMPPTVYSQHQIPTVVGYPTCNFNGDPALVGMTSQKPAPLGQAPLVKAPRANANPTLGIDVNAASQYMSGFDPRQGSTPQMAPLNYPAQAGYAAVGPTSMRRINTQPLPATRHQPVLQPVLQYQPAPRATRRQPSEPESPTGPVTMANASVMEPHIPIYRDEDKDKVPRILNPHQHPLAHRYQQQQSFDLSMMGYRSPDFGAQPLPPQDYSFGPDSGFGPVLTNGPLPNIHPPATSFNPHTRHQQMSSAPVVHRVHPPPMGVSYGQPFEGAPAQQLVSQRPIARMPSTAATKSQGRGRANAAAPKAAKPRANAGKKKGLPAAGIESWGGLNFANYTPDDGEGLLKGVAPSGSQSKRKREETAALLSVPMANHASGSDIGAEDDARSKRSRSSASSSQ